MNCCLLGNNEITANGETNTIGISFLWVVAGDRIEYSIDFVGVEFREAVNTKKFLLNEGLYT